VIRKLGLIGKFVEDCMFVRQILEVRRKALPIGYSSFYYLYAQTGSLINGCKTFYSRCSSIEMQASSDFI